MAADRLPLLAAHRHHGDGGRRQPRDHRNPGIGSLFVQATGASTRCASPGWRPETTLCVDAIEVGTAEPGACDDHARRRAARRPRRDRRGRPQFPVLDTLRAVGALAVLTTHTSFQTGEYLGNGVAARCWPASTSAWRSSSCSPASCSPGPTWPGGPGPPAAPGLRRYYGKRLLRILPVYVVTVVIAYVFDRRERGRRRPRLAAHARAARHLRRKPLPYGPDPDVEPGGRGGLLPGAAAPDARSPPGDGCAGAGRVAVPGGHGAHQHLWHLDWRRASTRTSTGAPGLWLPAYLTWFAVGIGLALVHVLAPARARRPPRCVAAVVAPGAPAGRVLGAGRRADAGGRHPARRARPCSRRRPSPSRSPSTCSTPLVGTLLVLSGVFAARRLPARDDLAARCATSATSATASSASTCPAGRGVRADGTRGLHRPGLQIWALTLVLSAWSPPRCSTGWWSCRRCASRAGSRRRGSASSRTSRPETTATTR